MSKLLREFQDIFTDDIPSEMPPLQGMDDHSIELFQEALHQISLLIDFPKLNKRRLCGKLMSL